MAVFCLALAFWEQRVLVFGLFSAISSLLVAVCSGWFAAPASSSAQQAVPGQSRRTGRPTWRSCGVIATNE
jgi:ABC-type antimicrobial peptide transport system permease subunit